MGAVLTNLSESLLSRRITLPASLPTLICEIVVDGGALVKTTDQINNK
jgi:hypothetical protein